MDTHDTHRFIFAGHAVFTLKSLVSGKHFTYMVLNQDQTFKVFLKVGSENFQRMGNIPISRRDDLVLPDWSRFSDDTPSVRALRWFLVHLGTGHMPDSVNFYHAGRCGRCGRELTTPESIERGLGPVCEGLI